MDKTLAQYLFDEVRKTLNFLVTKYGFHQPTLEVDEDIDFAYVTFMGQNLAIEFVLDERENDVTCEIARVVDGKKSTEFGVNSCGVRVRTRLTSILEARGVREKLFRNVGQLAFSERIPIIVEDFAAMLQKHGSEIMNDSEVAFAGQP